MRITLLSIVVTLGCSSTLGELPMRSESGGAGGGGGAAGLDAAGSGGSGGPSSGGSGGAGGTAGASGAGGAGASGAGAGGASVDAACEQRNLEACESDGECVEMHAYAVGHDHNSGTVFAACVPRDYECPHDGDLVTCSRSPEGTPWLFPSLCLPPEWPALDAAECGERGLADCETLDVAACATARFCRTIDGRLRSSADALMPIGCMAFDGGCGEAETCAHDGTETGEVYWFSNTCIPAGWVENPCTTGE